MAGIIGGLRVWIVLIISALSISLEIGGGDTEVGVAELPLDHIQRNALAGHLDGVGVAQLVRREPTSHPRLGGEPAQLRARARLRPGPPAGRAVDDAEQRTRWQLKPP